MHDIRVIRDDPEAFDAALARRGLEPVANKVLEFDAHQRKLKHDRDELNADKKKLSAFFGQLARAGEGHTEEAMNFKDQSIEVAKRISKIEKELQEASGVEALLELIPNLPAEDVPQGTDETDNVEVSIWGKKRAFDFDPQEHADIGPALGMDFETGTKLSGARFTFLHGSMARLHRALGQWMLDQQIENGYTECAPPLIVNDRAMYGTDKLPKFADDSFKTTLGLTDAERQEQFNSFMSQRMQLDGKVELPRALLDFENALFDQGFTRRWLIPTAEVSLTASVMGDILDDSALPMRLTALTQCFRSEAGSAGKDTRGFIRQHQFEKCELVSIVRPEDSEAEHERMTEAAEGILKALNLPYRKVLLCTGDMGFGARKTYDLEVWLPGQAAYREISSCSNTGDFQARRMKTRFKRQREKQKPEFVHTLNGSGLAVGRTLVAIMENYQQADGSVVIPDVLHPYMGGVTKLVPAA